jgi:regulator of replication initiation timing
MPECLFYIKGIEKPFTEKELKEYLIDQDLSKLKTIKDAIQERSAAKVVQFTPSGAGEAGGERGGVEQGEQGQKPAEEGKPIESNEKGQIEQSTDINESTEGLTKIANAISDTFVKGKYGLKALEEVIAKLQDTDIKAIYEKVKSKIESGLINVKEVRERVMTNKSGSEFDQAVLLYDRANLEGQEKDLNKELIVTTDPAQREKLQNQLIDIQNEILDNALANRAIGRSASTTFRLRQMWVNRALSLADMETQYMASRGITELTREQKVEIQQKYASINEARAELEKARTELDTAREENARLQIEIDKLKELKENAKKQKKDDIKKNASESIQKSNERVQQSRENLRKLGGNLNAGFDPRAAIELSKIAAEKVYQGIIKFDELVNSVYEDIKDVLPNFTKEDVAKHILAQKDKNGNYIESKESDAYLKAKAELNLDNKALKAKVKAYRDAQKKVALKQFEWQNERRKDIFNNRSTSEKIIDGILRWQRFAVLSYPSTIIKLLAAVGNQLALKPFKFAFNKLVSLVTPKSIKAKQPIWGDPKWESISKYYSTFFRNFNIANLKEQFGGIDTKELLYGNPHIYDEFVSAKGLLEIPGRSHGYIKSFIKNPEFEYANTQQVNYHITRMAEALDKLKDANLTDEQKAEWQKIYDENDVTNEDVMERMHKLSLEHARWAIFMNDSQIVSAFRRATSGKGWGKALLRSELPIVKIPVNYISRVFLNKYGLFKSFAGSGKEGIAGKLYTESKPGDFPGLAQIIVKGSKDLTPVQGDLLGKALNVGSMGAAFFAFGYINRKHIKKNDDGSVDFFGIHINKNLVHSPEYESMFSGAETGDKMDGDENWLTATVESDIDIMKHSPFINMLKYGFLPSLATAMMAKNDDTMWQKVGTAVSQKVANMALPGFSKQPAQWLDTESGKFSVTEPSVKRKAEGTFLNKMKQELMLGIPFLRNKVPAVKEKMMDYTKDENGTPITSAQKKEYEKLSSTYYDEYLTKAKKEGAFIEGKEDYVPFNKLTDEEKKEFIKTLRRDADEKAKKKLFGKKPVTEESATKKANYTMLKALFMGEDENEGQVENEEENKEEDK